MSETISELFEKHLGLPTLQELETSNQRRSCKGSSMIKNEISEIAFRAADKWVELDRPTAFTFRRRYAVHGHWNNKKFCILNIWDHDGTWLTSIAAA